MSILTNSSDEFELELIEKEMELLNMLHKYCDTTTYMEEDYYEEGMWNDTWRDWQDDENAYKDGWE